jgi:hypothetical protein
MAWTEADRVQIRHYLGFADLFLQADPRLEQAIASVQARAEGGTRPDDSAERQLRGWLGQLARLEARFEEVWDEAEALEMSDLRGVHAQVTHRRGAASSEVSRGRSTPLRSTTCSRRPSRTPAARASPSTPAVCAGEDAT